MRVKMRGRVWDFRRTAKRPRGAHGIADKSTRPPSIKVHAALRDETELETIIHEALHACLWDLDEEPIEETAESIASLLWKLGYRKGEP